jgi:hypothetical protein
MVEGRSLRGKDVRRMNVTIIDLSAYGLVGLSVVLGGYACYLFDRISEDLAHGIVGLFLGT